MTLVIEVILVTLIDEGHQIIAGRSPIGGALTRVAGGYWAGCAGDRGPAINAQLNGPSGVAVDGAGSLYIADAGNKRIRKVSPDGVITSLAGYNYPDCGPSGVPNAYVKFEYLAGVAVDAAARYTSATRITAVSEESPVASLRLLLITCALLV